MTPLTGRVAVVTGAATGIGSAVAVGLAGAGASVVVNHLDSPREAEAVVSRVRLAGGTATAVRADVSSRAEHAALVDATLAEFGR